MAIAAIGDCVLHRDHHNDTMLFRSRDAHPCARETYEQYMRGWDALASDVGARRRRIGRSVQGRPLVAYEIGEHGPVVMLTALMHGIEIIGSLALREVVRMLVVDGELLGAARYRIVPVVNPDAFAANLNRIGAGRSAWQRCNSNGVDLNRNFPPMASRSFAHPFSGSRFRAAPHYVGPHAFSEPESRAVRDLVAEDAPDLHIGFHSFGNMVLYPWAFTDAPNPRHTEYRRLCNAFNGGVRSITYDARQAMSLYPTTGDLDDWLDASFDTLSLTLEVGHPGRRLLHPRRLLNPFHWMNAPDADEAVDDAVPGVLAMLRAATMRPAVRPVPLPGRPSQVAFDFAAR